MAEQDNQVENKSNRFFHACYFFKCEVDRPRDDESRLPMDEEAHHTAAGQDQQSPQHAVEHRSAAAPALASAGDAGELWWQ
jgi:hypothetical protein